MADYIYDDLKALKEYDEKIRKKWWFNIVRPFYPKIDFSVDIMHVQQTICMQVLKNPIRNRVFSGFRNFVSALSKKAPVLKGMVPQDSYDPKLIDIIDSLRGAPCLDSLFFKHGSQYTEYLNLYKDVHYCAELAKVNEDLDPKLAMAIAKMHTEKRVGFFDLPRPNIAKIKNKMENAAFKSFCVKHGEALGQFSENFLAELFKLSEKQYDDEKIKRILTHCRSIQSGPESQSFDKTWLRPEDIQIILSLDEAVLAVLADKAVLEEIFVNRNYRGQNEGSEEDKYISWLKEPIAILNRDIIKDNAMLKKDEAFLKWILKLDGKERQELNGFLDQAQRIEPKALGEAVVSIFLQGQLPSFDQQAFFNALKILQEQGCFNKPESIATMIPSKKDGVEKFAKFCVDLSKRPLLLKMVDQDTFEKLFKSINNPLPILSFLQEQGILTESLLKKIQGSLSFTNLKVFQDDPRALEVLNSYNEDQKHEIISYLLSAHPINTKALKLLLSKLDEMPFSFFERIKKLSAAQADLIDRFWGNLNQNKTNLDSFFTFIECFDPKKTGLPDFHYELHNTEGFQDPQKAFSDLFCLNKEEMIQKLLSTPEYFAIIVNKLDQNNKALVEKIGAYFSDQNNRKDFTPEHLMNGLCFLLRTNSYDALKGILQLQDLFKDFSEQEGIDLFCKLTGIQEQLHENGESRALIPSFLDKLRHENPSVSAAIPTKNEKTGNKDYSPGVLYDECMDYIKDMMTDAEREAFKTYSEIECPSEEETLALRQAFDGSDSLLNFITKLSDEYGIEFVTDRALTGKAFDQGTDRLYKEKNIEAFCLVVQKVTGGDMMKMFPEHQVAPRV